MKFRQAVWRRWPAALVAGLLALAAALAALEGLGWPFLIAPLQALASEQLARRVSLGAGSGADVRLRLLGGLSLHTGHLEIAAPAWSSAPHLLSARGVEIELGYADLWRAYRGQRLRIQYLRAGTLDAQLERLADGRASWQFGRPATSAPLEPLPLPQWGALQVGSGRVQYRDAPLAIDVQARLSLQGDAAHSAGEPGQRMKLSITGVVRKLPVQIDAVAYGVLPWAAGDVPSEPVPVMVQARLGRAQLRFQGTATDATRLDGLLGGFRLTGPSLAAVGDVIGVTLPTTAAFRMDGLLRDRKSVV